MSDKRYLGWRDVDKTANAQQYVEDLDRYRSTNPAQETLELTYQLLNVQPGQQVFDMGCGTGDDVRALATAVGTDGYVIGMDRSAVMVSEARKRSLSTDLPTAFLVGDAHQLPFPDNRFDACRAVTVYDHLDDPTQAVREMIRVARPSAKILLAEVDWGALVVDHPDRTLTRTILNYHCDHHLKNGWIGRQLPNLLASLGVGHIVVKSGAFVLHNYQMANRFFGFSKAAQDAARDGIVTAVDAQNWIDSLQQADQENRFFSTMIGFVVCGRKQ